MGRPKTLPCLRATVLEVLRTKGDEEGHVRWTAIVNEVLGRELRPDFKAAKNAVSWMLKCLENERLAVWIYKGLWKATADQVYGEES